MALHNAGNEQSVQHFYMLSTDTAPTSARIGDRLYIIDTGIHKIWNGTAWVEYFSPALYSAT